MFLYALLLWFLPCLTRRDLYFAVTVAPEFRDEQRSKSILRCYRIELILFSALAAVAFIAGVACLGVGFVCAGFLIQIVTSFIPFYRARQRVLPYAVPPTMIREAELHEHSRIIPGGWITAFGPFVLVAACAGYLWIRPANPPTHFGHHRGGEHSIGLSVHNLSIYLVSTAGILVALTLILYGLAHWIRPIHARGSERLCELRFRRTAAAILVAWEYYIALQASWIVLVPRSGGLATVGLLPLGLVFVLGATIVLARMGQGGSRMPAAEETRLTSSTPPVGDRTRSPLSLT